MIAVPTAKKISRTHHRISLKTPGSALVSVSGVETGSTSGSVDIEFTDLERITSSKALNSLTKSEGEEKGTIPVEISKSDDSGDLKSRNPKSQIARGNREFRDGPRIS